LARGALYIRLPKGVQDRPLQVRCGSSAPGVGDILDLEFHALAALPVVWFQTPDHMDSAEFREGLDALLGLADAHRVAVMCAEAVPWRCHRQLIADTLVARGIEVRHVTGRGRAEPHRLTPFARMDGHRVVYDRGVPGTLVSP